MATTYEIETRIPFRTPLSHSDAVHNVLASAVGFKAHSDTRYLISLVVQSVGNSLAGTPLIDEIQLRAVAYARHSLLNLAVRLGVDLWAQEWTGDTLMNARIMYTEIVLQVTRAVLEVDDGSMDEYGYEGEERIGSDYDSEASALVEDHAEVDRATGTIDPEDGYYGLEDHAKMCAEFIEHLFPCSDVGFATSQPESTTVPTLAHFIAYTLHRAGDVIPGVVPFYALLLLSRLRRRSPALIASGHSLFISALMISAKFTCDTTYANDSWCGVTGNLFELEDLNRMEWEMCTRLEWMINVDQEELGAFEERIVREYCAGLGNPVWVPTRSRTGVLDENPLYSPSWAPASPNFQPNSDESPRSPPLSPPTMTLAYPSPPWSEGDMKMENDNEETEMEMESVEDEMSVEY